MLLPFFFQSKETRLLGSSSLLHSLFKDYCAKEMNSLIFELSNSR